MNTETSILGFYDLLKNISIECNWDYLEGDGNPSIEIPLEDSRSQRVLFTTETDIADQLLARYWTIIGSADLIDPERCLIENAKLDYGHFAIIGESLVLMETQLIIDADPLEMGSAISYLSAYADRFEEELFGIDEH